MEPEGLLRRSQGPVCIVSKEWRVLKLQSSRRPLCIRITECNEETVTDSRQGFRSIVAGIDHPVRCYTSPRFITYHRHTSDLYTGSTSLPSETLLSTLTAV